MRLIATAALLTALAAPAFAAGPATAPTVLPPPPIPHNYDPAPWWIDKPIMASIGYVTTEVQANRANLSATYEAVDRDVASATKIAAQKVKAISGALDAFGADKVRVTTSYGITPLYEQYRDKNGSMIDNARADKIDRYQVSVQVGVEIRDVRLAEPIYAILMSAKPSSSQSASFHLEPSDETRTQMFKLAIEDAKRRADLAATAAGGHIGGVRLIDPTARACETDVLLAPAQRTYDPTTPRPVPAPRMQNVPTAMISEMVVSANKRAQDAGLKPEDLQLPVQPPMERLQAKACVVYALG
jgi:uncharacterized protein YggE